MHFRYLKLALLAGALTANAPADSARLLVTKSNISNSENVLVPRTATRTQNSTGIDDEERDKFTFTHFAKSILMSDKDKYELIEENAISNVLELVRQKASASQILSDEEVDAVSGDLLANKAWVKWAYFIFVSRKSTVKDKIYAAIIAAMLAKCDYTALTKKLLDAAKYPDSKAFVNELIQVLIKQRFERYLQPDILLKLLRIDLKMDNLFESKELLMFFNYMSVRFRQPSMVDCFVVELKVFEKCFEPADFLKMLTSQSNAKYYRSRVYLTLIKEVWLNKKVLPSEVVFMLKPDKEHDYLFLDFEASRAAIGFWLDYYKRFCNEYQDYHETLMEVLTNGLWPRANLVLDAAKNANDETTRSFARSIESGHNPQGPPENFHDGLKARQ